VELRFQSCLALSSSQHYWQSRHLLKKNIKKHEKCVAGVFV